MRYRRMCNECGKHPAVFRRPNWGGNQIVADNDHTLCPRCYRAECQRQNAARLAAQIAEEEEAAQCPTKLEGFTLATDSV